jgi:membrane protein implicated in regulation of membrane protease activity
MAGVFVLGLPAIVFLIFMLNAVRLDPQQSMAFAWVSLLLLVALEVVFLMLLLRQRSRKDEPGQRDQFTGPQTNELEMKHPALLAEPLASVTEHTTRAFDSVPRERI